MVSALPVVLVVLVGITVGVVLVRRTLVSARDRPVTGPDVAPPPRVLAEQSKTITVMGRQATVSLSRTRDPMSDRLRAGGATGNGTLWLEVGLEPGWPAFGVQRRSAVLLAARGVVSLVGRAPRRVPTGDVDFDSHYLLVARPADVDAVRRLVGPEVVRALLDPPVAAFQVGPSLVLQYSLPPDADPDPLLTGAVRTAETLLRGRPAGDRNRPRF